MTPLVLIADDDPDVLKILRLGLVSKGYDVVTAQNGQAALTVLEHQDPQLVFLDIEMPKVSGIDVLRRIRQDRPALPVVIMTAHATIARAVEAMKEGATEFLTKPFKIDQMLFVCEKAVEREHLRREVEVLRSEVESRYQPLASKNRAMQSLIETAKKAALSDATILLLGESGVGKDLLARSIHGWSPRRQELFAPVICVALAEELLESELFGHEKGAFTGAHAQKLGKLEVASGGTVFLDEVGDMKPGLQAKLLRFLQNREFDRVGGTRSIKVDVRVIAATNRDLPQAVKAGLFRNDLFFRLNVVSLTVPPLRERQEDVPMLAESFLSRACREMKKPSMNISSTGMKKLCSYAWPGNVRELENAIERAVVLGSAHTLEPEDFVLQSIDLVGNDGTVGQRDDLPFHESVDRYKRRIIEEALARASGKRLRAAELLGLQPTYLSRLLKKMGIS